MGTINSAYSIIAGALDADQSALSVVANNVANANTAGYTEETPDWSQNAPIEIDGTSVGTGVTETGATSQRDRVLEERLDQQQQLASASGTRLTALNSMQALFTPDSGSSSATAGDIGSDITSFFNSFSSLEANPTDNARREEVLSSASTLAGDISGTASSLNEQHQALNQEAAGMATQVNSLTGAIAQLNLQIQSTSPDSDAGTLEDQRQQDLSQLSQLIGINQITTENNGLSITTTSGQLLVSEGQSFQLTTGTANGVTTFYVGGNNIVEGGDATAVGGQLGGYLTALGTDIPTALNALDQLAYSISTQVNGQNNAGVDASGDTGAAVTGSTTGAWTLDIFSPPPTYAANLASGGTDVAGAAAAMSVVMTDPDLVAAAGAGDGTGDNSNAVAMANLANRALIAPSASTAFNITQNLSSTTSTTAPDNTVTGQAMVYDSLGDSHQATVTYTNQGGGEWSYQVSLADLLAPDTSVAGQVSYSFGPGETVDPGTDLTITGMSAEGLKTITASSVTSGEELGNATTGYVGALNSAIATAGITGVSVVNTGGVLTISGATETSGSVIANPVASANASGTLTFTGGVLSSPAANVTGMTFSGLSDGASTLNLDWDLYGADGAPQVTQTADPSAQTAESQVGEGTTPINYFSNFVSTLGATVSQVTSENTAQNASVTQLQTQNDALSSVNLNDEASALSTLQTSYQAASQVFNILNTIMTSALNLGVETAVS